MNQLHEDQERMIEIIRKQESVRTPGMRLEYMDGSQRIYWAERLSGKSHQEAFEEAKAAIVLKGMFNGRCNRAACMNMPALWYNKAMYRFYCEPCALAINDSTRDLGPICELAKEATPNVA